jgi:hypothetical protein
MPAPGVSGSRQTVRLAHLHSDTYRSDISTRYIAATRCPDRLRGAGTAVVTARKAASCPARSCMTPSGPASLPASRNQPGRKRQGHHRPRQPLPGCRPGQRRRSSGQNRYLPRRALPPHRPPPRLQAGHRRRRPLHPGHRLAPALRPDARFHDLGSDYYAMRIDPERRKPNHVRQPTTWACRDAAGPGDPGRQPPQ